MPRVRVGLRLGSLLALLMQCFSEVLLYYILTTVAKCTCVQALVRIYTLISKQHVIQHGMVS
jgi:hypothetical protein